MTVVMRFAYLGCDNDVYQHQGPRYSWIGFDESTPMPEFRIRYMLSRPASTDPSLHCRMRLATNPGGPGHALHQHLFLGNRCPHCETGGRQAGAIGKSRTPLASRRKYSNCSRVSILWRERPVRRNRGRMRRRSISL